MSKQFQIKSVYETANMWSVKWSYNAQFFILEVSKYTNFIYNLSNKKYKIVHVLNVLKILFNNMEIVIALSKINIGMKH